MLKGLEMNCRGAYYLFLNTSPKQPIKQILMIKKKDFKTEPKNHTGL